MPDPSRLSRKEYSWINRIHISLTRYKVRTLEPYTCFIILRILWPLRRQLSFDSAKSLAHAHILSRLDYCNGLLATTNHHLLARLQRIQNCAARFVYGVSPLHHTAQLIRKLHWLRIESRVRYKVLVTIHNAIHSINSPHHLKEAISIAHQHSPREQPLRLVPYTHRKRTGGHAFHYYAPDMWNTLPGDLRRHTNIELFKRHLKTFLF